MAIVVFQDRVEGNSAILTQRGWTVYRTCIVSGLDSTFAGYAKIKAAYLAMIAFDPQADINRYHPHFGAALCKQIEPTSLSPDTVTLRLTYEEPDFRTSQVEFGSSADQVETDRDALAALVTVAYTYPATYPYDTSLQGKTVTQRGLMPMLLPEGTIRVTRRESLTVYQINQLKRYEGRLNDGPWDGDPTAIAGQWMCVSITATTDTFSLLAPYVRGPQPYDVTYMFQERPSGNVGGWRTTVRFIDPTTGQAPADLVANTGYKDVWLYASASFSALQLFGG